MNLKTTFLFTTAFLGAGFASMQAQSIKRIKNIKPSLVEVSPNPTHGELKVKSNDKIKSVLVYDIAGKIVAGGVNIRKLNYESSMNSLPNGLYIVKTETINGVYSTRLMKH